MVVQTRLFSCGLSISHVEHARRPPLNTLRAFEASALGNREFQSTFTLASRNLQV
jgi:hypothetical protein